MVENILARTTTYTHYIETINRDEFVFFIYGEYGETPMYLCMNRNSIDPILVNKIKEFIKNNITHLFLGSQEMLRNYNGLQNDPLLENFYYEFYDYGYALPEDVKSYVGWIYAHGQLDEESTRDTVQFILNTNSPVGYCNIENTNFCHTSGLYDVNYYMSNGEKRHVKLFFHSVHVNASNSVRKNDRIWFRGYLFNPLDVEAYYDCLMYYSSDNVGSLRNTLHS